jgi:hypothetical protein
MCTSSGEVDYQIDSLIAGLEITRRELKAQLEENTKAPLRLRTTGTE